MFSVEMSQCFNGSDCAVLMYVSITVTYLYVGRLYSN